MRLSRKQAKELIDNYKLKFQALINRNIIVSFGPHTFETVLLDVTMSKQADITNLPKKLLDEDGTYTPTLMLIDCTDGKLFFVLNDIINIILTMEGLQLIMANERICFRSV